MLYKITVKHLVFFILVLGSLTSLTVYCNASNKIDLLVAERANGNWLPNTIFSNEAPAYFYKGYWYSYCEAGLIRFNSINNEISVIPLPELKSKYPKIAGIAIVNNILWVAMRRDEGIFLFNLDRQSFAGSIKTAKSTGFGEGANVSIIKDTFNQKIWMSSFGHVDVYDIKIDKWTNLDALFSESGIGRPSSWHKIMPDGNFIWINGPASSYSRGGLIQVDLKRKENIVFRGDLVGSGHEPRRLDDMSLLSSPNYLWAYFHIENGYNFYIAVYDKKNDLWKSYNRGEIILAIDLLIKELPHIKWVGKNFLIDLSNRLLEKLEIDHPYRLTSNQLKMLKSASKRLTATYKKYNIDPNYDNYGLHEHSIYNSVMYGINKPWGENKPIQNINIAPIRYSRLIGLTERYAVVETNEGLGILDPMENTLKYLNPLTKLRADKLDIWWSKDQKKATIRSYYFEQEDSEEYYNFISLDFDNLKIDRIEKPEEHKEKEFKALPKNRMLMADKEIILQWDGLFIKYFKK